MSEAVLETWRVRRPVRRAGRGWLVVTASAILAAGLGVVALSALATAVSRAVPPPLPEPPKATWVDIQKPVQIYSLQAKALDALPFSYTARRFTGGDQREDVLAFGTLASPQPAIRLKLQHGASGPATAGPLFADLAREAADAGLSVTRSGLPDAMATRFGTFEIADVTLARSSGAGTAACDGFRLVLGKPALSMTGLACGTPAHPLTRASLGCLLDRLDLASVGDDRTLIDFFAQTELTRNPTCSGMRLGPDELHAAWLDDKPATSRKSLRRH